MIRTRYMFRVLAAHRVTKRGRALTLAARQGARARTACLAALCAAAPFIGPAARAAGVPPRAPDQELSGVRRNLSSEDRDALGRVAYAEAGNQGEEGLAAVLHSVLNRAADGRFGNGVQGVVDAPGQFEPVMRAGGSWRRLPPLSAERKVVIDTILDLILQGRLPDLTGGSTYFQNPAIVAQRVAAGAVPASLLNFGGHAPAAVVRDHSFYRQAFGEAASWHPAARAWLASAASPALAPGEGKLIRLGATRGTVPRIRILHGGAPSS